MNETLYKYYLHITRTETSTEPNIWNRDLQQNDCCVLTNKAKNYPKRARSEEVIIYTELA